MENMPGCLNFKRRDTAKLMSFSIFPRTVFKTKTKINGEIVVKEQFGQYTLHVQNLIQSGGIIKEIWEKPLKQVTHNKLHVTSCLVLGLGGGTVVQLIKSHWPGAKIVGIEVDPVIVKIGKRFFGLDKIKSLEIITINAFEWIYSHFDDTYHRSEDFDLIIVDMYTGYEPPYQIEEEKFLKKIKKLLSKKGLVIFNWLKGKSEKQFEKKIKKIFPAIEKIETPTNLFFVLKLKYV